MLDYRYHYAVLATEDRVSSHRQHATARASRRIFRLAGARSVQRVGR